MKKFIIAAGLAAALIVPSMASADVQRNQEQTGTLTVHVAYGDLSSVHTYKVEINPCDHTFTGNDGSSRWAENERITAGTVNGSDITFHAVYPGTYSWDVASGGKGSDNEGRTFDVTTGLTNVKDSTHYKNHGEFVKQSDDKNDAAHSCIGMPVNSSK